MTSPGTPPADPIERIGDELRRLAGDISAATRRRASRTRVRALRLAAGASSRLSAWAERMAAARRYLLDPVGAWTHDDAVAVSAAAAIGPRYLLAGLLLAASYTYATGGTPGEALSPVLVQIVWALGRIAVIALLVPAGRLPRPRLVAAYLAGLVPFVFGVTAALRLAALIASALLTFTGLTGAGLGGRRARTAVLWAFGGQVGVIVFGWIARAALAGFLV